MGKKEFDLLDLLYDGQDSSIDVVDLRNRNIKFNLYPHTNTFAKLNRILHQRD